MNRYEIALNKRVPAEKTSWNSYERESGQIFDFSLIIGKPPKGAEICIYEASDQDMVIGMAERYYFYFRKKFRPMAKGHVKVPVLHALCGLEVSRHRRQ
jgi:hypothetical protein